MLKQSENAAAMLRRKMGLSCAVLAGSLAAMAAMAAGPDVIVGELPDVSNWTSGGAIGGKRAYSVGTTSCNVGDQPLLWIRDTNQHPVISGNMYRLQNGRFEQIGQSWLKHGFTALQGTVCDSCSGQWPNGTRLGVGCSDPYSSGLNGSQGGLGPKYQINASTGVYPYPYTAGTTTNALSKRLVVDDADVGIAGAAYFVASMYVASDDAASGNSNNNQSYRRINVNATSKDISLTGTTRRTIPAIYAWKENGLGAGLPDPEVNITTVDVPGDGRFLVGAKVTPLGAGVFRYEYAIQNMNSHRSGQSFSIPLPAGAVVTNVGFHDVDYHSGEPFSLTDWTPVVTSTSITWATNTFAQDANANALRFDTLYNFRFDCNMPPAVGNGNLELFRPGTPTTVAASTVIPSPDGQYHPINDLCANASTIGEGTIAFVSDGAETDGPAEPAACVTNGQTQYDHDLWYRFTPACSGPVRVSTCGSTFDTKIAIYAACPTGPGQSIACNDDSACSGGGNLQSNATFTGVGGSAYLIRVGGYSGASGVGSLTVTGPQCGPINEACEGAISLANGVAVSGSTAGTQVNGTASCGAANASPDLWYKYRTTTAGSLTFTTCDLGTGTYDTVLSIFTGTCGSLAEVGCNDDTNGGCGLRSTVTLTGTANTDYFVRVSGYQGASGAFKIKASGGAGVIPPANDACANRSGIPLGNTPFTTVGATTDGPAHTGCNFFNNSQVTNDIWFNYPSQCDGTLFISLCGNATWDTKIAVYNGEGCNNLDSRLIGCSDDDCGNQSVVSLAAATHDFFTIRVGGYNGATGAGTLVLTCIPTCIADFNQDGGIDGTDVESFFTAWENAEPRADVDGDGGVTGDDVGFFFDLWERGSC